MEEPISTLANSRRWISNSLQTSQQPDFILLSYNILSEHLLRKSSYFNKIKPENWNRATRHARLLSELDRVSADLLCLQEVDKDYWTQHLEVDLLQRGYTIQACSWRDEEPSEGVVTCARETAFQRTDEEDRCGRLSDLVVTRLLDPELPDFQSLANYSSAPQRYCIAQLRHRKSGRKLTVGNAHISYQRPPKPDLRAAQSVAMVAETASVANGDSFLLCGDFNSTPESMAYRLITMASPDKDKLLAPSAETEAKAQLPLTHLLTTAAGNQNGCGAGVASAYLAVADSEPECTLNLTNNAGCVDFIFYNPVQLGSVAVLEVPSLYILQDKDFVPDQNLASDHFSIAARFRFL